MITGIKRKYLVLSGKGGVGKSSVAVNLAVWLAGQGKQIGLLDVDIHGPSVPKLLGLEDAQLHAVDEKIEPVLYGETLKVMSIGFMLQNRNEAVIWRGPMKHNMIQQFAEKAIWTISSWIARPGRATRPCPRSRCWEPSTASSLSRPLRTWRYWTCASV